MMTRINISLLLFLCYSSMISAQNVKIDSSFGDEGKLLLPQYNTEVSVRALTTNNGDIIFVGNNYDDGVYSAINRIDSNGNFVPEFGINGIADKIGSLDNFVITSICFQNDSSILVCGNFEIGNFTQGFIAMFDKWGNQDLLFGSSGIATISDESNNIELYDIAIFKDNRIAVCGILQGEDPERGIIFKFLENGELDLSFGQGGSIKPKVQEYETFINLNIYDDSRILIAGHSAGSGLSDIYKIFTARFNAEGEYDLTYNSTGKNIVDIPESLINNCAQAIILEDGSIMAGGFTFVNEVNALIVKFRPDGQLDSDFGINGKLVMDIGGFDSFVRCFKQLKDGTILCHVNAVFDDESGNPRFEQIILNIDMKGNLISDFATMGMFRFSLGFNNANPFFLVTYGSNIYTGANYDDGLQGNDMSGIVKLKLDYTMNRYVETEPVYKFYPNPTSGFIYINNAPNNAVIIYDSFGLEVFRSENQNSYIDISHLNCGHYYLKIGKSLPQLLIKIN